MIGTEKNRENKTEKAGEKIQRPLGVHFFFFNKQASIEKKGNKKLFKKTQNKELCTWETNWTTET